MAETMKDWALKYADIGLAVFPLKPKDKRPATENGCKAATTDSRQIETWWSRWPNANIGIATGSVSGGLVVIDLDVDKDKGINGYESLAIWQKENGELPETWTSITGRGGYHYIYIDGATNRNRAGLYDGIDIRGEGGYIVAPPSIHPNGRQYEWEQGPGDCEIAQADNRVMNFLMGPVPERWEKQTFQEPEMIPAGERTSTMIRLSGSLKAKGLDDEAIKAAVRAENEKKCIPPLTDQELEKTVFPALKRGWRTEKPYTAVHDTGKFRQQKNHSLEMLTMEEVEEKSPEWLITDYIPRYQITTLAGDGGAGKTTIWCDIAAAVSSGNPCFLDAGIPEDFSKADPGTVLFFSSEDSAEYTLRSRLRKAGAALENIHSISLKDERFSDVKFDSPFLERLIEHYRPKLVIFDPIQSFIPPDIQMGQRNAMRSCLNPLIGLGEKYGTTFLVIVHANKQSGVYGRKRIADSADIWDISRSVLMVGDTPEKGVRYLSHEKCNYGMTGDTVLFSIENGSIINKGYTEKKDREFVSENSFIVQQRPQKEEAKEFILSFLGDGEKEVAELDEMAAAQSITKNSLKNAKAELRKEGKIKYRNFGYGSDRKYYISLIPSEKVNE
ncbi:MAG: bifunctional DNA primase/polymerase [Clostridium sp.]|uniref:bifunctional DNA primase/polymerase n=1 Tax=Faecalicatena contorta TaxID=39482 RepID=UPI002909A55E|nr:bifunctional DNA primase/polymerase [Clostridium sp.]